MNHSQEKNKLKEIMPEEAQTLYLLDKDIEPTYLKYAQNVKGNMNKEVEETMKMMYDKIENISEEREIIKRNRIEILEMKTIITEIKIH